MAKKDEGKSPTVAAQPTSHDKYEVEEAVRTLLRAEEIKADKKLMAAVHKKLDGNKKAITSIQGLKDRRKELEEEAAETEA